MTLHIGGDAGRSNRGDGALCAVLRIGNHCIEGDGIDTRYATTDLGPTIGIVANLEDISVSVVGLPCSINLRNEGGSTIDLDGLLATIDGFEGVIYTQLKDITCLVRKNRGVIGCFCACE